VDIVATKTIHTTLIYRSTST